MADAVREIALVEDGARVHHATSHHNEYAPVNVIDRSAGKPWVSNGAYPQVIVVSFPTAMHISSIDMKSYNVQSVMLSRSTSDQVSASDFEDFSDTKTLKATRGSAQTESIMGVSGGQVVARHLKLTILSGYDLFCGVYRLVVTGQEASAAQIQLQHQQSVASAGGAPVATQQSTSAAGGGGSSRGFSFGGQTPQTSPTDRRQFNFRQTALNRDEQPLPAQAAASAGGQFQSTFRLPSSKKKRLLDGSGHPMDSEATSGGDVGDPEDAETAAAIRDEDDDPDGVVAIGGQLDDDEDDEDDNTSSADPPAWNPRLPGGGGMVAAGAQRILNSRQFSQDGAGGGAEGRFGF